LIDLAAALFINVYQRCFFCTDENWLIKSENINRDAATQVFLYCFYRFYTHNIGGNQPNLCVFWWRK
jgi:hypothetical protein